MQEFHELKIFWICCPFSRILTFTLLFQNLWINSWQKFIFGYWSFKFNLGQYLGQYLGFSFPYFSLIGFFFGFFFGLCFLMLSFVLYFWWMGSCPWILYIQGFSLQSCKSSIYLCYFIILCLIWWNFLLQNYEVVNFESNNCMCNSICEWVIGSSF